MTNLTLDVLWVIEHEKKLKVALEGADLEESIKEATVELSVRKESVILSLRRLSPLAISDQYSLQTGWKPVRRKPDIREVIKCREGKEGMHCL
jgi:hypothetical protein